MGDEVKKLIEQSLSALEIEAGTEALEKMTIYANEIVRFGKRINLTGSPTAEDFVRGPLFDALTLLKVLEPRGTLVDIGSGGGLPGIPTAILAPQTVVTMAEPRSRRVAFLNHIVHLLAIDAEIMECRDEEIGERLWDGAVAQAVWPPEEWLARAGRLIAPGGAVYVLASSPIDSAGMSGELEVKSQFFTSRPWDGKKRYSAKLGRSSS